MFKAKFIEFFNQLLDLFEDKNKAVYRRLIYLRHYIRNEIPEQTLIHNLTTEYAKPEIKSYISRRNNKFLKNTPYSDDVDLLWEACSAENKMIIWKWIDMLVNILGGDDLD